MSKVRAIARRCIYIHENGKQCGGYAVGNSALCFWHSPEHAEQRKQAGRNGGRARMTQLARRVDGPDQLRTVNDVLRLVEAAVNQYLAQKSAEIERVSTEKSG